RSAGPASSDGSQLPRLIWPAGWVSRLVRALHQARMTSARCLVPVVLDFAVGVEAPPLLPRDAEPVGFEVGSHPRQLPQFQAVEGRAQIPVADVAARAVVRSGWDPAVGMAGVVEVEIAPGVGVLVEHQARTGRAHDP